MGKMPGQAQTQLGDLFRHGAFRTPWPTKGGALLAQRALSGARGALCHDSTVCTVEKGSRGASVSTVAETQRMAIRPRAS